MSSGDGDALYAWQVQEPDGRWSMVGALVAEFGSHTPLVHRSLDIILQLANYAKSHAATTGQPLRLARFTLDKTLE
jgi:hypothetical protein